MSTRAEQIAEFEEWWNSPNRHERPSPVLRALLRGEQHYILDEHEDAFPADMGIAGPAEHWNRLFRAPDAAAKLERKK